jgi:PRTRC genetic system protein C
MVTETTETPKPAAEPEKGKRIFVIDNREFDDPDPAMTVDEIKAHFASFFPELANSEASEAKRGADTLISFIKKVGTKG